LQEPLDPPRKKKEPLDPFSRLEPVILKICQKKEKKINTEGELRVDCDDYIHRSKIQTGDRCSISSDFTHTRRGIYEASRRAGPASSSPAPRDAGVWEAAAGK
jgi:hypothetical protein